MTTSKPTSLSSLIKVSNFIRYFFILLLASPVVSNADVFELAPIEWDLNSHSLISNHTIAGNTFTDEWGFTLTDPSLLYSSSGFVTDGFFVTDIENLTGYLIGENFDRLDFKADKNDASRSSLSVLLQSSILSIGNYAIVLEGTTIGTNGGYYGESNPASTVPEPGSTWLIVSGLLGLIVFTRHKSIAA